MTTKDRKLLLPNWRSTTLGEVTRLETGGTPSRKNQQYWANGNIPWVKTTEIDYHVIEKTGETITPMGLANSAAKIFPKGTLLVAMYGQGVTRGRVAVLGINAATNQACAAITPLDNTELTTWFIYYYLQYNYENLRQMGHGANQRNLNMALLRRFPIAYPPIPEQRRIAAVLGLVQRAIEQQERLIALTTELKKALLHKLFTEGLRGEPQKQTEIGPVPESWNVVPLSMLLRQGLQNGAFVRKSQFGKGVLFANVVNMYGDTYVNFDRVDRVTVSEREIELYGLTAGDLLVVRSSLKREGIGQNSVVGPLFEPTIFDCHLIRVAVDNAKLLPEFLSFYWRSPTGKLDLIQRSKTVTMTTLNQAGLSGAIVPNPPLDEQRQTIDVLLAVESKIQHHQRKKSCLTDMFRTLLYQLMTAQIRVDDIEDAPAIQFEPESTCHATSGTPD